MMQYNDCNVQLHLGADWVQVTGKVQDLGELDSDFKNMYISRADPTFAGGACATLGFGV